MELPQTTPLKISAHTDLKQEQGVQGKILFDTEPSQQYKHKQTNLTIAKNMFPNFHLTNSVQKSKQEDRLWKSDKAVKGINIFEKKKDTFSSIGKPKYNNQAEGQITDTQSNQGYNGYFLGLKGRQSGVMFLESESNSSVVDKQTFNSARNITADGFKNNNLHNHKLTSVSQLSNIGSLNTPSTFTTKEPISSSNSNSYWTQFQSSRNGIPLQMLQMKQTYSSKSTQLPIPNIEIAQQEELSTFRKLIFQESNISTDHPPLSQYQSNNTQIGQNSILSTSSTNQHIVQTMPSPHTHSHSSHQLAIDFHKSLQKSSSQISIISNIANSSKNYKNEVTQKEKQCNKESNKDLLILQLQDIIYQQKKSFQAELAATNKKHESKIKSLTQKCGQLLFQIGEIKGNMNGLKDLTKNLQHQFSEINYLMKYTQMQNDKNNEKCTHRSTNEDKYHFLSKTTQESIEDNPYNSYQKLITLSTQDRVNSNEQELLPEKREGEEGSSQPQQRISQQLQNKINELQQELQYKNMLLSEQQQPEQQQQYYLHHLHQQQQQPQQQKQQLLQQLCISSPKIQNYLLFDKSSSSKKNSNDKEMSDTSLLQYQYADQIIKSKVEQNSRENFQKEDQLKAKEKRLELKEQQVRQLSQQLDKYNEQLVRSKSQQKELKNMFQTVFEQQSDTNSQQKEIASSEIRNLKKSLKAAEQKEFNDNLIISDLKAQILFLQTYKVQSQKDKSSNMNYHSKSLSQNCQLTQFGQNNMNSQTKIHHNHTPKSINFPSPSDLKFNQQYLKPKSGRDHKNPQSRMSSTIQSSSQLNDTCNYFRTLAAGDQ